METIQINEVKKDLMKSKTIAKFSHYCHGNLYYNVFVFETLYQFPISTVESVTDGNFKFGVELSSDLGTTTFNDEMKGSELIRWITKSIDDGTFIKL